MQVKLAFVIAAAGVGARFNNQVPKQYHSIHSKTVLENTFFRLYEGFPKARFVVALDPKDIWFKDTLCFNHPKLTAVKGGRTRLESVRNALQYLEPFAPDWVLVHDAARPCVPIVDVEKLMTQCIEANRGGLLVAPMTDTLKKLGSDGKVSTVNRSNYFRALTPQMFPFKNLLEAYLKVKSQDGALTDDASLMEGQGVDPLMVEGSATNIKITYPEDLQTAAFYLQSEKVELS